MFSKLYPVTILALVFLLTLCGPTRATVLNGNFDDGLYQWDIIGTVDATGDIMSPTADTALLSDDFPGSGLYQAVNTGQGTFLFEFDFLANFSSDLSADPFAFPDTLWVTLYFVNDSSWYVDDILDGTTDDNRPIFDMDDSGILALYPGVTITPGARGVDWHHAALIFTSNYQYTIPAFELFDLNFVIGDSEVQIDNVSITPTQAPIPEPATAALLALGLTGLFGRGRRK